MLLFIDYTAITSYKMSELGLLRPNPLLGRELVPPDCVEELSYQTVLTRRETGFTNFWAGVPEGYVYL